MGDKLPEAPCTMFTNYKRVDGFEVSLTLRGENVEQVATLLDAAIKKIAANGGTPVSRQRVGGGFPVKEKDYVEGRTCPIDGGRLVKSVTKTGKNLIKCENNKWNAMLKRAEGCSFTEWQDDNRMATRLPERDINDY